MSAVLGSLNAGVTAVDADLRVLAWNAKAEDLWGIRTDEATGQHLFSLDIGLPLEPLRPVLKRQLVDDADPDVLRPLDRGPGHRHQARALRRRRGHRRTADDGGRRRVTAGLAEQRRTGRRRPISSGV
jgi:PAS domain-containing protein